VDQSRLTEALAWSSTGLAGGVAIGAAVVGHVIDGWGAQAGFVAVAIAGLLLTLSALLVRGPQRSAEVSTTAAKSESTDTPAADSSHPRVGTRS
jgi:hypothetical protein